MNSPSIAPAGFGDGDADGVVVGGDGEVRTAADIAEEAEEAAFQAALSKFKPNWVAEQYAQRPGLLLLLFSLIAAGLCSGLAGVYTKLDVDVMFEGFEEPEHYTMRREQGRRTASDNIIKDDVVRARRGSTLMRGDYDTALTYPAWRVTLIYIRQDGGSILHEDALRAIRDFERILYESPVYRRWGWRDHASPSIGTRPIHGETDDARDVHVMSSPPAPISSLVQYFFPRRLSSVEAMKMAMEARCCGTPGMASGQSRAVCPWMWGENQVPFLSGVDGPADPDSPVHCPAQGQRACCPSCSAASCQLSNQNCARCPMVPVQMLDGSYGGLLMDGSGQQLQPINDTLRYAIRGENADSVQWFLGDDFDTTRLTTSRLRSEMVFGAPLPGYKHASDHSADQKSELVDNLDDLLPLLRSFRYPGVRLVYGGDGITEAEVLETLFQDLKLATASFCVVLVYVSWHIRSVFLGVLSMLQVAVITPLASIFLYAAVFQYSYLGPLNILSFYITIGIGVDDVFVFTNAFLHCQKPAKDGDDPRPLRLAERMAYALRKAGLAMLVTSATSAAAFLSNTVSSIPAVAGFGLLSGLLVIMNYVLVMTMFPALISFWYQRVNPLGCGVCRKPLRSVQEAIAERREVEMTDLGELGGPQAAPPRLEGLPVRAARAAGTEGPADGRSLQSVEISGLGEEGDEDETSKRVCSSSSPGITDTERIDQVVKNDAHLQTPELPPTTGGSLPDDVVEGVPTVPSGQPMVGVVAPDDGYEAADLLLVRKRVSRTRHVFEHYGFPCIMRLRYVLVAVTVALIGLFVFASLRLQHREDPPSFYADDHNIHIYRDQESIFSKGGFCVREDHSCAAYHTERRTGVVGCDGVMFSGAKLDTCGECGGDDSTCRGCDGVAGSGLVWKCGVCGGTEEDCVVRQVTPAPTYSPGTGPDGPPGRFTVAITVELDTDCGAYVNASAANRVKIENELVADMRRLLAGLLSPGDDLVAGAVSCGSVVFEVRVQSANPGMTPAAVAAIVNTAVSLDRTKAAAVVAGMPGSFDVQSVSVGVPTAPPFVLLPLPTAAPASRPPSAPLTWPPTAAPATRGPTSSPVTLPPSAAPASSPPTQAPDTRPPTAPPTVGTQAPRRPSAAPSAGPSLAPATPTAPPSAAPSSAPASSQPSAAPSSPAPSVAPTTPPTAAPTAHPALTPTTTPTAPTAQPTAPPTLPPTAEPTQAPSGSPTARPSAAPTAATVGPTAPPTLTPTVAPTRPPTAAPSAAPTTLAPTAPPTVSPSTSAPTTVAPTAAPHVDGTPSAAPVSSYPSTAPSVSAPSASPTSFPSAAPSVSAPTAAPVVAPTAAPTERTEHPSAAPVKRTDAPTSASPTQQPTATDPPTAAPPPSGSPTTLSPTAPPTAAPVTQPPSDSPTTLPPTQAPSAAPVTAVPTQQPSQQPTSAPSTAAPSLAPSALDRCAGVVCNATACHTAASCNASTGLCVSDQLPNGTACDDGDNVTQHDACRDGACRGVLLCAAVNCSSAERSCMTAPTCSPLTGRCLTEPLPEGTACDDGNPNTTNDVCSGGSCSGIDPCAGVVCSPRGRECDATPFCDRSVGRCVQPFKPDRVPCDDGNAATVDDRCLQGVCMGDCTNRTCPAQRECRLPGVYNATTCRCENPWAPNGARCDDGNADTVGDECVRGVCSGRKRCGGQICNVATDLQCSTVGCDPESGACKRQDKEDGVRCDDGDSASTDDRCWCGQCLADSPCAGVECEPRECQVTGGCNTCTGKCLYSWAPAGSPCTSVPFGVCGSGGCRSRCEGVTCDPPSQCHLAGVCDAQTGRCRDRMSSNGTACDDGNPLTFDDACLNGVCTGLSMCLRVNCSEPTHGGCRTWVCDEYTANCIERLQPDGAGCDDGNGSSVLDSCTAGVCAGVDPPTAVPTASPVQWCSPQCPPRLLANGQCDIECNNAQCGWDGGAPPPCGAPPTRSPEREPQRSLVVNVRFDALCETYLYATLQGRESLDAAVVAGIAEVVGLGSATAHLRDVTCGSLLYSVEVTGPVSLLRPDSVRSRITTACIPPGDCIAPAEAVAMYGAPFSLLSVTAADLTQPPTAAPAPPLASCDRGLCPANRTCNLLTDQCVCLGHWEGPDCDRCSLQCTQYGGVCGQDGTCLACDGLPTHEFPPKRVRDFCGVCGPPWPEGTSHRVAEPNATCRGCDGVLHSRKKVDQCGVCGGHDECKLVTGPDTNTVLVYVVWGIVAGKSGFDKSEDRGYVTYDLDFDVADPVCQQAMLTFCRELNDTALRAGHLQRPGALCMLDGLDRWLDKRRRQGYTHHGYCPDGECTDSGLPVEKFAFMPALMGYLNTRPPDATQAGFENWPAPSRVKYMRFEFRTPQKTTASAFTLKDEFDWWEAAVRDTAAKLPPGCNRPYQTAYEWPGAFAQVTAVNGLAYSVGISLVVTAVTILVFTADPRMTFLVIFTMVGIIATTFAFFWANGWRIGPVEAVALSVVIGLSVDFCVHFAEAYTDVCALFRRQGRPIRRDQVVRTVLADMGSPLLHAALTTVLSCSVLLFCVIRPLVKLGFIMVISISVSITFAVFFFCPLLIVVGPLTTRKTVRRRVFFFFVSAALVAGAVAAVTISEAPGPNGEPLFS
eukprot:TRINITY_DN929_c3_g1_i2.p1 TRINITY_DN929_c3_g1~~TRINITY_DN929_c3_g1_i2.p1  ORF type:complete len:2620 (+),score=805.34 TRINITY_DN929_c3_g1_i2:73-7932(+)